MTGVITRGSFSKLLWPGIDAIWQNDNQEYPPEWSKIFNVESLTKAFAEELGFVGMGLAPAKSEGSAVSYDSMRQGYTARYEPIVFALGFIITREMYEDNQYAEVALRETKALKFSMNQTKEVIHANIFNRAVNAAYTYADGQPLLSDARPNISGGTWSNKLATPADLSEAALEQANIDISDFRDDRGNHIAVMTKDLIVHPSNEYNAARILRSTNRVATDYNDINALKALNVFQNDTIVNHYFENPKAWFIKTNCPDGLKSKERRALEFTNDGDFDTENAKYKATARYIPGMTDPRGVFGSEGA